VKLEDLKSKSSQNFHILKATMFTEKTRHYIANLSDEDLMEYICAGEGTYDPDAIAFAKEEISRRGIDPTHIATLQAGATEKLVAAKADDDARASEPLDGWWRLVSVVFGGVILTPIGWLILLWLGHRGFARKKQEFVRFSALGIGIGLLLNALVGFMAGHSTIGIVLLFLGILLVLAMMWSIQRLPPVPSPSRGFPVIPSARPTENE